MRLIDADALIEKAYIMQEPNGFIHSVVTERQIIATPTIDAVPVVRCRDCKFWRKLNSSLLGEVVCCIAQGYMNVQKAETDFCSLAERRDDNAAD